MLTLLLRMLQEMLSEQGGLSHSSHCDVDVDDLLDDPELERLHAERLAAMQKEAEKRVQLQRKGHGELQEVPVPCKPRTAALVHVKASRIVSCMQAHALHHATPLSSVPDGSCRCKKGTFWRW